MICPTCEHIFGGGVSGVTEARNLLGRLVGLIMLGGEAAARSGVAHPWLQEIGIRTVPRQFAELTGGLAGRASSIFGHDGLDQHAATMKIIKAAGLPDTWGLCPTCGGSAEVVTAKERVDELMSLTPSSWPESLNKWLGCFDRESILKSDEIMRVAFMDYVRDVEGLT